MKNKIFIVIAVICILLISNFCTGFMLIEEKSDDVKYCGGSDFTNESEIITYAKKVLTEYSIDGDLPNYIGQTNSSNCANIAGTVLIGFYDRFYEELIPDYKTYIKIGSVIRYRAGSSETQNVMSNLYTLMQTDVTTAGTTYNGFQNGMTSFISSRGYTYSIEDLGNLDFTKYKSAVEAGKPVAVFLDNCSFLSSENNTGNSAIINSKHSTGTHIVIACGYKIDTYYDSNNKVIATRTYLKVASGLLEFGIAYLCLDGKSEIDKADAVVIS